MPPIMTVKMTPASIHTAKPMAENFTASFFTWGYLSALHTQASRMPGMPTKAPMTNQANFMPPDSFMSGAGGYTGCAYMGCS